MVIARRRPRAFAITPSIGKLTLPRDADITRELEPTGVLALPVEIAYANHVWQLPFLHRDPFDRLRWHRPWSQA